MDLPPNLEMDASFGGWWNDKDESFFYSFLMNPVGAVVAGTCGSPSHVTPNGIATQ